METLRQNHGKTNRKTLRRIDVRERYAFTLIELLVVIVIIAMLSGITTVVVRKARITVRESLVKAQLEQVSMALDAYKAKYGDYPPDFSDPDAVMRHVRKRWPRYGVTDIAQFNNHIMWGSQLSAFVDANMSNASFSFAFNNGNEYWDFDGTVGANYIAPLVFWLGGLPGKTGAPIGFFNSPKSPLGFESGVTTPAQANAAWTNINIASAGIQREEQFFKFPDNSVASSYGGTSLHVPVYLINKLPVMYFKATSNVYSATNVGAYALPANPAGTKYYVFNPATGLGVAAPYCRPTAGQWYGEDRFQLVHPGEDACFGSQAVPNNGVMLPRSPQNGLYMSPEDTDNIANFLSEGSTMESEFK